jgi:hypothetical protein
MNMFIQPADGEATRSINFTAAVQGLSIGESTSRLKRIDTDQNFQAIQEALQNMRDTLRNNTMPAVRRAAERTGNKYTVEVTDFMTVGRNWYLITIVTRTE